MSATTWLAATRPRSLPRGLGFRGPALGAIWLSTLALAAAAPSQVPVSLHDQLPWMLVTGCGWAALATACVALTPAAPGHRRWSGSVVAAWLATMIGGPLCPATETGFPPLLAVGPAVAALVTGMVCLQQAGKVAR